MVKLVPASEYLSGDVRLKLEQAIAAAEDNPIYLRNVEALQEVIPKTIALDEIDIKFGATWLPQEQYAAGILRFPIIEQFVNEKLGVVLDKCLYYKSSTQWVFELAQFANTSTHPNVYTYGAQGSAQSVLGHELVLDALNKKVKRLTWKDADGHTHQDAEGNELVKRRLVELTLAFKDWIATSEHAKVVEDLYNRVFNNLVLPSYGPCLLALEGMAPEWQERIRSRPYQLAAASRSILNREGNTALWWEVGLGKMAALIMIAVTRRRIDPSYRPVIVVQKSTVQQFRKAVNEIYPGSRFLIPTEHQFEKRRRQKFMAQIAAGNAQGHWDGVVMSHEQFKLLRLRPQTLLPILEAKLSDINATISMLDPEELEKKGRKKREVKALLAKQEWYEQRIQEAVNESQDSNELFFEDLHLTAMLYDEAHVVKQQQIDTKLVNVAGIPEDFSAIAWDYANKLAYIERTYGKGRCVEATGTAIGNSMAEVYLKEMNLYPEKMIRMGLDDFDSWCAVHADVSTQVEFRPTGVPALITRFRGFNNLRELKMRLRDSADIRTAEEEGVQRPVPKMRTVSAPMSAAQFAYMQDLLARTKEVHSRKPRQWPRLDKDGNQMVDGDGKPAWKYDNNLFITTDGRQSSQDHRLKDREASDFDDSKVNVAVRRIAKLYNKTRQERKDANGFLVWPALATQVVFLDVGTPGGVGFCLYDDIRSKLIQMGVPADQIAFDHDYPTDDDRAELDQRLNEGKMAIIITSTKKGGVGRNFHKRLVAAHLIDTTWGYVSDDQRIGRIIRAGNLCSKVLIYRYLTTGVNGNSGFDAFMLQLCKEKKKGACSVLSPDLTTRRTEEDSEENPALGYAALMAISCGDERYINLIKLEMDCDAAKRSLNATAMEISRLRSEVRWDESELEQSRHSMAEYQINGQKAKESLISLESSFEATLLGNKLSEPTASVYIRAIFKKIVEEGRANQQSMSLGSVGGFEVFAYVYREKSGYTRYYLSLRENGSSYPVEYKHSCKDWSFSGVILDTLRDIANKSEKLQSKIEQLEQGLPVKQNELASKTQEREGQAIVLNNLADQLLALQIELGIKKDESGVKAQASEDDMVEDEAIAA
jgi:N12 class adenine-specific DNA methylase